MSKRDFIIALFWILLGALVVTESVRLGIGALDNPGPGLFPFLVGIALICCALTIFIGSLLAFKEDRTSSGQSQWRGIDFRKLSLVVLSLLAYALVLEKAGYLLSAFAILLFLFRYMGARKWSSSLLLAFSTTVLTYLLFVARS
jgi:putative tricarboxylic transport membrane protein